MRFVLILALLLGWPSAAVLAGDITGTVTIASPIAHHAVGPRHNPRYSDSATVPPPEDETRNVVVYLEKVDPAAFKVPAGHPVMAQKNKTFIPSVLPIVAGQSVEFPNNDRVFHNVYSDSKAGAFELPEYRQGDSRTQTFTQPGVVELFCAIHASMNAYILVLQNPFFGQPDPSHTYTIAGIPKGHYNLVVWHPRVASKSQAIDVPERGMLKLDITL